MRRWKMNTSRGFPPPAGVSAAELLLPFAGFQGWNLTWASSPDRANCYFAYLKEIHSVLLSAAQKRRWLISPWEALMRIFKSSERPGQMDNKCRRGWSFLIFTESRPLRGKECRGYKAMDHAHRTSGSPESSQIAEENPGTDPGKLQFSARLEEKHGSQKWEGPFLRRSSRKHDSAAVQNNDSYSRGTGKKALTLMLTCPNRCSRMSVGPRWVEISGKGTRQQTGVLSCRLSLLGR